MSAGVKANNDGSAAIQVGGSDAIQISAALNTTFVGTVTSPTGTLYPLVSGTAVASTSGTSIDFTGIPSTAKRITVMLNGVSTSGTSLPILQIGSTTFSTSGYTSQAWSGAGSSGVITSGLVFVNSNTAGSAWSGLLTLVLFGSNTWTEFGGVGQSGLTANGASSGGYSPALAGTLDRVRITTVNGTDTFDAGSINIMWE